MRIHCLRRSLVLGALILAATSMSIQAAMLYRASGIDYRGEKQTVDINVLVGRDAVRADVYVHGQMQVSMIEFDKSIVVVDHVARVFTTRNLRRDADATMAAPGDWKQTSRRQFAMGAYCRVVEARLTDALRQERCVAAEENMIGDVAFANSGTYVGELFAAIVISSDASSLFVRIADAIERASPTALPLIVSNYSQGKLVAQVQVQRASEASVKKASFNIPSGFRDVTDSQFAHQATQ